MNKPEDPRLIATRNIVLDAFDVERVQRVGHMRCCRFPVARMGAQLGDHGVVEH